MGHSVLTICVPQVSTHCHPVVRTEEPEEVLHRWRSGPWWVQAPLGWRKTGEAAGGGGALMAPGGEASGRSPVRSPGVILSSLNRELNLWALILLGKL